jgi:plastocyanin
MLGWSFFLIKKATYMKQTETQKALLLLAAVVILFSFAAVVYRAHTLPKDGSMGKSQAKPSANTQAAVATDVVTINNFAFSPMVITIKMDTSVTWTNQDTVNHTVTSDSGSELASENFGRDASFSHTFTKAGTYTYHCAPHPYMHGTVIVTQ